MQLKFLEMRLENFGSFRTPQQVSLNSEPGLYFLRGRNLTNPRLGSNGAGKSTLLNALAWCLFGKTTNGLGSTDVKPWNSKATTTVGVSFAVDDKVWTVVRSARPNMLLVNGHEAKQELVEAGLGLSASVFEQTVLLGQGRPLFHDLDNREKLALLSDVLDLDRWDRYAQRASERVARLNQALAAAQGAMNVATELAEKLKASHAKAVKERDEWEQEREDNLERLEKAHKELTRKLKKADDVCTELDLRADGAGAEAKHYRNGIEKLENQEFEAKVKLAEIDGTIRGLMEKEAELKIQMAECLVNKICPTCKQRVKTEDAAQHKEELLGKACKNAEKLGQARRDRKAALGVVKECEERTADYRKQQKDFDTLEDQLEAELRVARKEKDSLDKELASITHDMEFWQAHENPYLMSVRDLRKARDEAIEQKEGHKEEAARCERLLARSKFWIKGFKDVRLSILSELLQELELVTNAMLDEVGLVGWAIQYSVERETKVGTVQRGLITTVLSPDNSEPVKWASWSGGEAQRVRLVGALALSQVLLGRAGVEPNLEILDEPSRHLSIEGVTDTCEFLAERARTLGKCIVLADHQAVESSKFAGIVTVIKTKDGSTLEVQS